MLHDLHELPDRTTRECDICIVGSGAAGLAIAQALLPSGLEVLLLESGARPVEPDTQALYDCETTGLPLPGAMDGRFRILGGSTTQWGGQSLPLDELDFEVRDWVPDSGWPLRRSELESYYARAAAFLSIDALNFDTELFSLLRIEPPAFDTGVARYHFSKWSPAPNLRNTYVPPIAASPSVSLIQHANLVRIDLDPAHECVRELHARSLSGRELRVRARQLVLATGAIEVARILLANRHQRIPGLGNGRGWVGRCLQEHPGGALATLRGERAGALQHAFNTFYRGGLRYTPRFSMSPEFQRRHRVLNASALLSFDPGADTAYARLRLVLAQLRARRLTATALREAVSALPYLPQLIRPAFEYLARGRAFAPDPIVRLSMLTEQQPNPESRVTLSAGLDALGMPRASIHWSLTDLTRLTLGTYLEALRDEFARLGLGCVEPDAWLSAQGEAWKLAVRDQKHHMGTARMSRSPETGVVDPECRVHEVENLWIASGAVFPTSGHSNPTLTIIALAIRLADRLAAELGPAAQSRRAGATDRNAESGEIAARATR